jgi:hypothetical protein
MNIAQRLVEEATKYGLRLRLNGGRVQFSTNANVSPDFLQRLREYRAEIAFELSRSCVACGSAHAPFGFGFDYRNPFRTKWFCNSCASFRRE